MRRRRSDEKNIEEPKNVEVEMQKAERRTQNANQRIKRRMPNVVTIRHFAISVKRLSFCIYFLILHFSFLSLLQHLIFNIPYPFFCSLAQVSFRVTVLLNTSFSSEVSLSRQKYPLRKNWQRSVKRMCIKDGSA